MEAHTPQELSLSVAEKVIFSINMKDVETDFFFKGEEGDQRSIY